MAPTCGASSFPSLPSCTHPNVVFTHGSSLTSPSRPFSNPRSAPQLTANLPGSTRRPFPTPWPSRPMQDGQLTSPAQKERLSSVTCPVIQSSVPPPVNTQLPATRDTPLSRFRDPLDDPPRPPGSCSSILNPALTSQLQRSELCRHWWIPGARPNHSVVVRVTSHVIQPLLF